MKPRVECGFRKWAISYDNEQNAIIVSYNYHPIYGEIALSDASICDLENLGDMFTGLAKLAKLQIK